MEIHKPKPWHGWREFLKEYAIIFIGVLTALAAEQAVEAQHWRHKIEEAEEAMRLELSQDDGPQAFVRVAIASCLHDQLETMRKGLPKGLPSPAFQHAANTYQAPMRTYDAEAWKTVVASDVGGHITAQRLMAWSGPYRLMPILSDDSLRESEFIADLKGEVADLGSDGFPPEKTARVRTTIEQLDRLNTFITTVSTIVLLRSSALGAGVAPGDQAKLVQTARKSYGSCVKSPDLTRRQALGDFSLEQEVLANGLVAPGK